MGCYRCYGLLSDTHTTSSETAVPVVVYTITSKLKKYIVLFVLWLKLCVDYTTTLSMHAECVLIVVGLGDVKFYISLSVYNYRNVSAC